MLGKYSNFKEKFRITYYPLDIFLAVGIYIILWLDIFLAVGIYITLWLF